MYALARAIGAGALGFAVAGCEGPDAVDVRAPAMADRSPPAELSGPAFTSAEDAYELCWITSSTADQEQVSRVHVRGERPLWSSTLRSDGVASRSVWTYVDRGETTRVERRDGGRRDGAYELGEPRVYEYQNGNLLRYTRGEAITQYRADGRVVFDWHEGRHYTHTWAFDVAGHAIRLEITDLETHPWPTLEWTWDGDRLVSESQYGETTTVTDWVEHDGDLPVRAEGSFVSVSDGATHTWTEVWTWEGGHPTSYSTQHMGQEARTHATWTWDGDRLLTSTSSRGSEAWTWDDEGRAVAWEELDADGRVEAWRTWTWDGDRLVTLEQEERGNWGSTTWGRACPPAAWASAAPWPWTDTPLPGWPIEAPLPNEW